MKKEEMDDKLDQEWSDILNAVIDDNQIRLNSDGEVDVEYIKFSKEGLQVFADWSNEKRNLVNNGADIVWKIQAKIETYVPRFALILWAVDRALKTNDSKEIEPYYIEKAIRLGEYFYYQNLKVYKIVKGINSLSTREKNLLNLLPDNFTRKEAIEKAHTLGVSSATTDRFLKLNKGILFDSKARGSYFKLSK